MLRKTLSSLSLGVILAGCSSPSQQTSSSSHWATCHEIDDCSASPEAVACTSGYCVDTDGNRIAAATASPTPVGDGGPGSSGNVACNPFDPKELPVTLGEVLGVGKGPDGTTYMADRSTGSSTLDRVFVSEGNALVRKRVTGSGERGGAPDQTLYTLSFDDGAGGKALLIETEMGQASAMGLGPANGKAFIGDPGAVTTALTVQNRNVISDFALRNLPGLVAVEYVADVQDGSLIVVTRPEDDFAYDDFRLFRGSESDLAERHVFSVARTRSGNTTIDFDEGGARVTAEFTWVLEPEMSHPGPGTLTGAGSDQTMTQRFPTPTAFSEVSFTCLPRSALGR